MQASAVRTGLVLSGGGLRGAAHIGMLKVFARVGILQKVDVLAGTSAGAIIGAMVASATPIEQIEQAVLALMGMPCHDLFDLNVAGLRDVVCAGDTDKFTGFIAGQQLGGIVERNLTILRRFADYPTLSPEERQKVKDLLLVAVNLDTGIKTVFCDTSRYQQYDEAALCGSLTLPQAARASASAPAIVPPFACVDAPDCGCSGDLIGGPPTFLDGAMRDNCPLKLSVRLAGCTRVLALNLGYAGDRVQNVASQGMAEIIGQGMAIMGSQQLDADMQHLRQQVAAGDLDLSAYVLNPRLFDMGTFDVHRLPEAIKRGEDAAAWFLATLDAELGIFNPDGAVNMDRLFARQGVMEYDYPDPERAARRAELIRELQQPRPRNAPACNFKKELTKIALLVLAAAASVSLALFTLGGAIGLALKPGAATIADIFAFWDGGIVLFLAGWLVFYLLFRLLACRRKAG